MRRLSVVFLLAASALDAAPVPKAVKAKTFDLTGKWVTAERVNQGKEVSEPWVWEVGGEKLVTFSMSGGGMWYRTHEGANTSFVRPDPDKRDEYDYRYSSAGQELTYRGRVQWDGDEWVFCFGEAGADRPTEVKAGKDVYYLRFKRWESK